MIFEHFKPMKAARVADWTKEPLGDNWWVEEKYDGARYYLVLEPNKNARLISSRLSSAVGNEGELIDKSANAPHICKDFRVKSLTVLDGEIITGGNCKSKDVVSAIGGLPETSLLYQKKHGAAIFMAFDCVVFNGIDIKGTELSKRRVCLEAVIKMLNHISIQVSETFAICFAQAVLNRVWNNGGEGIMLKNGNSLYLPNNRNRHNWIKVKNVKTFDVVILGFEEPKEFSTNVKGEEVVNSHFAKGLIGAIVYGVFVDGKPKVLGTVSGFNENIRHIMSISRHTYLCKVIEVEGQEIGENGAIRHPRFKRFRPDMDPAECTFDKLFIS